MAAVQNRFKRIVWVGLVSPEQAAVLEQHLPDYNAEHPQEQCLLVPVDSQLYEKFYTFCKEVLWKMFHYTQADPFQAEGWAAYCEINQRIANTILEKAQSRDSVWVHDYHLMMVPQMLRRKHSKVIPLNLRASRERSLSVTSAASVIEETSSEDINLRIGFFLHSPFPTSEIFRCLPIRSELLLGISNCDLIGFQTFDYARQFMRSCFRILGADQDIDGSPNSITWGDRRTSIGVHPIGINPDRFIPPSAIAPGSTESRKEERIRGLVDTYRERYDGLKIIFGKDSLEEIKGIPHKFRAFERLLVDHPEWVGKLVFVQVTYPPTVQSPLPIIPSYFSADQDNERSSLSPAQEALLAEINEQVTKINSRFGSLLYQPAQHFFKHPSLVELTALYRVADVGFILPLRDGMNLTAHEFAVASFQKKSPLVLSEFTGSARILPGAFLCNPFNTMQVARKLHAALTLDEEAREIAHRHITTSIRCHTAEGWGQRFLSALFSASQQSDLKTSARSLDMDLIKESYLATPQRRIFFLDYDGTLTPIVARPELAIPQPQMVEVLSQLCANPQNLVIVVSGRDCASLEHWLGDIPSLALSAEHGAFLRRNAVSGWEPGYSHDVDLSWQPAVEVVLQHYVSRTPGSWIEKKKNNLVWHYRASDPVFSAYQAKELLVHLRESIVSKLPVEVLSGKKAIEIRPAGIHKGTIVKKLLAEEHWGFAVAIGDDKTDEDMFHALLHRPSCYSIFVGSSHTTSANFKIASPDDVQRLLGDLAALSV